MMNLSRRQKMEGNDSGKFWEGVVSTERRRLAVRGCRSDRPRQTFSGILRILGDGMYLFQQRAPLCTGSLVAA